MEEETRRCLRKWISESLIFKRISTNSLGESNGGVAERVILVVGDGCSGGIEVFTHVAVSIEGREIAACAVTDGEEAADSACSLEGA